jgi:hypothetical protein
MWGAVTISALQFVIRTGESVLLPDASTDASFSSAPWGTLSPLHAAA